MADQAMDQTSQAPVDGGMGGPPGGNPSAYGGMSRGPMNPSMAPTSAPKRGGMINKPKFSGVGMNDIVGNNQILKQLIGEFLGTALLVFFGIGSIITASGVITCYWYKNLGTAQGCIGSRLATDSKLHDETGFTYYYFLLPDMCSILGGPGPDPGNGGPGPDPGNGGPGPDPGNGGPGPDPGDYGPYPDDESSRAGSHRSKKDPLKACSGINPLLAAIHISFGFGMAVACIAQAIGHVSGCHLNPAVSFGLVAAGGCSIMKALIYTVAQIFGAIFGAGLLKLCTWNYVGGVVDKPSDPPDFKSDTYGWHLGVSTLGGADPFTGIAIECWLTFILVFVVCGVCDGGRKDVTGSGPLAIGFAVFLCHVVGIHFTGSSVNPARSIGPVLFVSDKVVPYKYTDLGVYIVGPLLGGILAGLTYNIFFRAPDEASPQVAPENHQKNA